MCRILGHKSCFEPASDRQLSLKADPYPTSETAYKPHVYPTRLTLNLLVSHQESSVGGAQSLHMLRIDKPGKDAKGMTPGKMKETIDSSRPSDLETPWMLRFRLSTRRAV